MVSRGASRGPLKASIRGLSPKKGPKPLGLVVAWQHQCQHRHRRVTWPECEDEVAGGNANPGLEVDPVLDGAGLDV